MNAQIDEKPKKRILLVEDERVMRESLRTMLAKDNNIVLEANNGAEAYSLFTKSQVDIVVTDSAMPFVTGEELATRIRRTAPTLPILMITGRGYKGGPKSPVNAVLQKPFEYGELKKEISRLLKPPSPGGTEFVTQSPTTTALV